MLFGSSVEKTLEREIREQYLLAKDKLGQAVEVLARIESSARSQEYLYGTETTLDEVTSIKNTFTDTLKKLNENVVLNLFRDESVEKSFKAYTKNCKVIQENHLEEDIDKQIAATRWNDVGYAWRKYLRTFTPEKVDWELHECERDPSKSIYLKLDDYHKLQEFYNKESYKDHQRAYELLTGDAALSNLQSLKNQLEHTISQVEQKLDYVHAELVPLLATIQEDEDRDELEDRDRRLGIGTAKDSIIDLGL